MAEPTSAAIVAIAGLITAVSGLIVAITALVRALRDRPGQNRNNGT